jgi:tRNA U34 5-methylaminomethyl-2-thiouridine-forming methyltransferase MnmC
MQTEIKITEDGSATLYVPELREHYHSTFGAVQEAMHVFIAAGLQLFKTNNPSVFEIGFGTGLNTLLTLLQVNQFESIHYSAVELFPVEIEKIDSLFYPSFLKLDEEHRNQFSAIHSAPWDQAVEINPKFILTKYKASMLDFQFSSKCDIVYFDAFSPAVQPELWHSTVFQKIRNAMNPGGILVTYCAKGEVRRILQTCGFKVERIPGPPGKREMIRATR